MASRERRPQLLACCTQRGCGGCKPNHRPLTPPPPPPPGSCDAVQNCDNFGVSGGILDEFSVMKFSAVTRPRTAEAAAAHLFRRIINGRGLQAAAVAAPEGKATE